MKTEKVSSEQIKNTISKLLNIPVEELNNDVGAGDFPQWDSLGHLNLLTSLEDLYGNDNDNLDIYELETVSDIINAFTQESNE